LELRSDDPHGDGLNLFLGSGVGRGVDGVVGLPDDDYDDYADLEALHQASLKLGYEAGPVDILNEQPSFQRGHHSSSAFGDSWSRGVHKLVRDKGLLDPARHENLVMLPGAPRAVGPRRHAAGMIPGQQHGGATPSAGVFDTHQFVTHGTTSLNARDVPDGRGGIGSPAHTAARMQLVGGRKVRPRHRDSARLSSDDALPALEIGRVKKRRAFLNSEGVLQFHEVEEVAVEEAAVPPKPPGFWTRSSWCSTTLTRQELKLVLPKSCSDFDEVPMMPCMSIKYVRNLRPIMRDRNKNWRQTSFRNVYVGRGTLARKKKAKTEKKDMFGSDEVTWVEGYPLRKKMLHCEACLISDEYTIVTIHGVGITGRIYNEASNENIPRALVVSSHTPADCGKYQIKLQVKDLPDLFHDRMELLGPGRTKPLCSALVRMLYFEYSKSDPRKNVDETPIFGGYGADEYVRPPLPESSEDEGEDENDHEGEGDGEGEGKPLSAGGEKHGGNGEKKNGKHKIVGHEHEVVIPEDGVIRGADGVDHVLLPDKMKVLCISRGAKLNRRQRRANWLKRRAVLRANGVLPETPRPPKLPLRFVNRVYCGPAIRAGMHFYVSVYCDPERPNNYVIKFHEPRTCNVMHYNMGRRLCGELAMEPRQPHKWTPKIEANVCRKVIDLLEVKTWLPPAPSTAPLQMAIFFGPVPGISVPAHRRIKEVRKKSGHRPRVPRIVFGRKAMREHGLLVRRDKKYTKRKLKRPEWERKHGLRIALGTLKWEGYRMIYEIYMLSKDGMLFNLHLFEPGSNSTSLTIEFNMFDFRAFLKGTHALEIWEKRRKKYMKRFKKMKMGYNEKTDEVAEAFKLLLFDRITLLQEGRRPKPIVEVVNGPHLEHEKRAAMDAKKKAESERKQAKEALIAIEKAFDDAEKGDDDAAKGKEGTDAPKIDPEGTKGAAVADGDTVDTVAVDGGQLFKEGWEEGKEKGEDAAAPREDDSSEEKKVDTEYATLNDVKGIDDDGKGIEIVEFEEEGEGYESDVSDVSNFNDNHHRTMLHFHGRYLAIDRVIYSRWHSIVDQRAHSKMNSSYSSSYSSSSSRSSPGLSAGSSPASSKTAGEDSADDENESAVVVADANKGKEENEEKEKEGAETTAAGKENEPGGGKEVLDDDSGNANEEEEEEEGEEEPPSDAESEDLAASEVESNKSFSGSSLMSGSSESDEDPETVYILVTVRQRGWRLYFEVYEPLECRYYYPQVPEETSRSMTAEFTRLDKLKRNTIIGVNVGGMVMRDGKLPNSTIVTFQQEGEEGSSSEEDDFL
jgi:hypothetical protein